VHSGLRKPYRAVIASRVLCGQAITQGIAQVEIASQKALAMTLAPELIT
jgi:hypothetical protein